MIYVICKMDQEYNQPVYQFTIEGPAGLDFPKVYTTFRDWMRDNHEGVSPYGKDYQTMFIHWLQMYFSCEKAGEQMQFIDDCLRYE